DRDRVGIRRRGRRPGIGVPGPGQRIPGRRRRRVSLRTAARSGRQMGQPRRERGDAGDTERGCRFAVDRIAASGDTKSRSPTMNPNPPPARNPNPEQGALARARKALKLAAANLPHLSGLCYTVRVKVTRKYPVAAVGASGLMLVHPRVFAEAPIADLVFV